MPSPGSTRTFLFDFAAMISTHRCKLKLLHAPPNPPPQGGRAREPDFPLPLEGEGRGGVERRRISSSPEPGLAQLVLLLERADRRRLLQGEADIVEAVQQAM